MAEIGTGAAPDPPPLAYVAAFVLYVALGVVLKTVVLNWIVGPLFLFLVLYLVPALWRSRSRSPAR